MLVSNYRRDEEDEEGLDRSEGTPMENSDDREVKPIEKTWLPSQVQRQYKTIDLAPKLNMEYLNVSGNGMQYMNGSDDREMSVNKYQGGPMVGPQRQNNGGGGVKNTFTGYVEDESMNVRLFDREMVSFIQDGVALDPTGKKWLSNSCNVENKSKKLVEKELNGDERARERDPSNVNGFLGTWNDLSRRVKVGLSVSEGMELELKQLEERELNGMTKKQKIQEVKQVELSSIWHGRQLDKEQALLWLKPSKQLVTRAESRNSIQISAVSSQVFSMMKNDRGGDDEQVTTRELIQKLKPVEYENSLPKKCIQTWAEAKRGISSVRFIPKYGNYLLASSMDHSIRIYDVYNKRKCMMTYLGHAHAVRDIDWHPEGTQFISCSYDNTVKLWDALTGQVLQSFQDDRSLPIVGRFYPMDPNIFLVGQSNKKIIQWDCRSNQIVQEYNRHLGAINTITWIDENRRFVTSSDDKSIRVWEFNIPVDIKYIAEPHMHSMPSITVHPNQKWFLCQSLDNQILVYSTKDRFRLNRSKRFTGHLIAGFACGISVSPDGRCVTSGDSHGNLIFWDWKTTRILKKIKAHANTTIDVQWHPLELSRLATAGWDNMTKLWD